MSTTQAPSNEPIGRSISTSLSSRTGRLLVYVLVFLWTIPTFGVFASSFRNEIDVKTTGWWQIFWKPSLTLSNYKSVLGSKSGGDNLSTFWLNSLRITIPATIISVGVAALAAYAFSWMEFKGRDWLFTAVVGMLVIPLQMSLIPLLRLFTGGAHANRWLVAAISAALVIGCLALRMRILALVLLVIGAILVLFGGNPITVFPDFNLQNNVLTIWIAHTCFGMPFCIFLLKNFISSLPKELLEAAKVDGAGHLTIFRKVVLPLSVPALASLTIFQFVYIFNDLLIGKVYGGSKNQPIIAKLVEVSGTRGQSWHLLTAAAFISMLTPLVVFFALQKHFVRGLLAGAVKG
jgi:alpha-glucoside transport system permease protein